MKTRWPTVALVLALAGCVESMDSRDMAQDLAREYCAHLHCTEPEISQCAEYEEHTLCDERCRYLTVCQDGTCLQEVKCDPARRCRGDYRGNLRRARRCLGQLESTPATCGPLGAEADDAPACAGVLDPRNF